MAITLSTATGADVLSILALLDASKLPTVGLEKHIATTLVARDQTALIGCAAVEVYGTAGLLRSVAVAKDHRGTGWGEKLTRAALDLAGRRGVSNIYLLTTTADKFVPRFGFVRISRKEIDPALAESEELRGACPETAIAMRTELRA